MGCCGETGETSSSSTPGTNSIANSQLAQVPAHTIKGNNSGSTANASDLTSTQVTAELNPFVGDSGSGGTKGLVPAPAAGDAAAGKFLKADGTFALPSGSSGANTALSNLSSTAVNAHIIPGADGTIDLGATASTFRTGYIQFFRDPSSVLQIDLTSRTAFSSDGNASQNWESREEYDSANIVSHNYETRVLSDTAGNISANYGTSRFYDSSGNTSLLWNARIMRDPAELTSFNWGNRTALDENGGISFDYSLTRSFYNSNGTVSYNFDTNVFQDSAAVESADLSSRQLFDNTANKAADWQQRELYDSSVVLSYDWEGRAFHGPTGSSILDYGTANELKFPVTITAGGTTGNQTINKISGTVNFAAAATSLTVTNSAVHANSIVVAVVRTNDATAAIKNVVPSSGSFVIRLSAAATAETSVGFFVFN